MNYKYEECYVAFLDILGFREMIKEDSCEEIFNLFNSIDNKSPRNKLRDYYTENYIPYDEVKKIVMSDSVVLFIEASIENGLSAVIMYCCALANSLIKRKKPVFIRGGIAKDKFYFQDNHFYGMALNVAYELQEKVAKYPRIIMFEKLQEEIGYSSELCTRYLYKDKDGFAVIDSLCAVKKSDLDHLNKLCKNALNKYIDSGIREKYLYVLGRIEEKYNIINKDNVYN